MCCGMHKWLKALVVTVPLSPHEPPEWLFNHIAELVRKVLAQY